MLEYSERKNKGKLMLDKKKSIIVAVIMLIVGCCAYRLLYKGQNAIVLNGNVEIHDVNLAFRLAGRVDTIKVEEGSYVKKGDLLASLDKDVFQAKLDYAKAQLKAETINFQNAEKDYKRNVGLLKKKSVSEKVYDASKTAYEVAKSKVEAAQATYDYMNIDYKDADLFSPVDGTVLTRNIEPGEMIASGTVVFSIMPNAQTRIKTFANEAVLSRIKIGDTVYVNIETMPKKKFKGHIGFISSEAEFTPKNIETSELRTSLMYRVRVILDEPAPELKQGMPVTVSYEK